MPLLGGNGGALQEEPLAGFVLHGGFFELDFHGIVGVPDYFGDFGGTAGADFAIDPFEEVEATAPEFPAPALVADAVVPEVFAREGGVGVDRVANEAACGVGVHGEEEGDEEVVSVPEGFEGLLTDLVVCGGVHEEHTEEHDVASDTASLGVVNLDSSFRPDLTTLHVEEIHVVGGDMDAGEDEQRVGDLSMEPLSLVQW